MKPTPKLMPDTAQRVAQPKALVDLDASDLNGSGSVSCPNPKMALWSGHPKVFIEVASQGQGRCPYCGTVYRLASGAASHH